MAENEAPKADQPNTVKAKQVKAGTEVSEMVVIETSTFEPTRSDLVDRAQDIFRETVAQNYGDTKLTDIKLIKVDHRVGHQAEYHFTGKLG